MTLEELGPFDSVLDVGGNVGEFAERCRHAWPDATITSFEPLPGAANANRERAHGRWWVEEVALSDDHGRATLRFCVNQHSASTMQTPGTSRRERFGIVDRFENVDVHTHRLDDVARRGGSVAGRCLLKIDVEGHELKVLDGAGETLERVAVVVCEVNQDPHLFEGAPHPTVIDSTLRSYGLFLAGVLGVQADRAGAIVQFDGVWSR